MEDWTCWHLFRFKWQLNYYAEKCKVPKKSFPGCDRHLAYIMLHIVIIRASTVTYLEEIIDIFFSWEKTERKASQAATRSRAEMQHQKSSPWEPLGRTRHLVITDRGWGSTISTSVLSRYVKRPHKRRLASDTLSRASYRAAP